MWRFLGKQIVSVQFFFFIFDSNNTFRNSKTDYAIGKILRVFSLNSYLILIVCIET